MSAQPRALEDVWAAGYRSVFGSCYNKLPHHRYDSRKSIGHSLLFYRVLHRIWSRAVNYRLLIEYDFAGCAVLAGRNKEPHHLNQWNFSEDFISLTISVLTESDPMTSAAASSFLAESKSNPSLWPFTRRYTPSINKRIANRFPCIRKNIGGVVSAPGIRKAHSTWEFNLILCPEFGTDVIVANAIDG